MKQRSTYTSNDETFDENDIRTVILSEALMFQQG